MNLIYKVNEDFLSGKLTEPINLSEIEENIRIRKNQISILIIFFGIILGSLLVLGGIVTITPHVYEDISIIERIIGISLGLFCGGIGIRFIILVLTLLRYKVTPISIIVEQLIHSKKIYNGHIIDIYKLENNKTKITFEFEKEKTKIIESYIVNHNVDMNQSNEILIIEYRIFIVLL